MDLHQYEVMERKPGTVTTQFPLAKPSQYLIMKVKYYGKKFNKEAMRKTIPSLFTYTILEPI